MESREGVFGLEGFAVVSQVELEGVGEGGALGRSGDVGLRPAENGFGEGEEGWGVRRWVGRSRSLGRKSRKRAVSGEEVLVDVRAGFEQGGDGDDQTLRLDVAEPLFMRELFRETSPWRLVGHRPEVDEADGFDAAGLHFIKGANSLGLRLAFAMHFAEACLPIAAVMLLLAAFVIVEVEQQLKALVVGAHGGE